MRKLGLRASIHPLVSRSRNGSPRRGLIIGVREIGGLTIGGLESGRVEESIDAQCINSTSSINYLTITDQNNFVPSSNLIGLIKLSGQLR